MHLHLSLFPHVLYPLSHECARYCWSLSCFPALQIPDMVYQDLRVKWPRALYEDIWSRAIKLMLNSYVGSTVESGSLRISCVTTAVCKALRAKQVIQFDLN